MRSIAVLMMFALTACPSDDPGEGTEGAPDSGVETPADSGVTTDGGSGADDAGTPDAGRTDIRRFGPPEVGPGPGLDGGPVDKGIRADAGGDNPDDLLFQCRDFCLNGFIGFDQQGNQIDCPDDRLAILGVGEDACGTYCEEHAETYDSDQWWLMQACVFERQCGDRAGCTWQALDEWAANACTGICADHGQCDADRFGAACAAGCAEHLEARGARVGSGIASCHRQAQDNQACFEEGGSPEELSACQCDARDDCLNRTRDQVTTVTALYCRLNERCTGEPDDNACRSGYWFDHMAAAADLVGIASCLQQFDEAHEFCEGDAFQELDACIR